MAQIGILALQGDYAKHAAVIKRLGHRVVYVKDKQSLSICEKLIIPGGESTSIIKLIDRLYLREALVKFTRIKPVFGTCAGLIILATDVCDFALESLAAIDLRVRRNAYGTQVDSFIGKIEVKIGSVPFECDGYFIRAPKIEACLGNTQALAWHKDDVVMASNKNILVATFHPELSDDDQIHRFFIDKF